MIYTLERDFQNATVGEDISILEEIHKDDKNIAILKRPLLNMEEEVERMLKSKFSFQSSGTPDEIFHLFQAKQLVTGKEYPHITQDVSLLLYRFAQLTKRNELNVFLGTVHDDMCRKFHTDINYLRLLCTYQGPGTWWLPDVAVNRRGRKRQFMDDDVTEGHLIQEAPTGAVVILKGALYPNAKPIIYRSPPIERHGIKRLLLRVDIKRENLAEL